MAVHKVEDQSGRSSSPSVIREDGKPTEEEGKSALKGTVELGKNVVKNNIVRNAINMIPNPMARAVATNTYGIYNSFKALKRQYGFSERISVCKSILENFADIQSAEALDAFRRLTVWKNKLDIAKYNRKVARLSNDPSRLALAESEYESAKLNVAKYDNAFRLLKRQDQAAANGITVDQSQLPAM